MSVKKNCFAYNPNTGTCNALKVLECDFKECTFFKTQKENCKSCREAKGSLITCEQCKKIYVV